MDGTGQLNTEKDMQMQENGQFSSRDGQGKTQKNNVMMPVAGTIFFRGLNAVVRAGRGLIQFPAST